MTYCLLFHITHNFIINKLVEVTYDDACDKVFRKQPKFHQRIR